jgi:hypothetical protein
MAVFLWGIHMLDKILELHRKKIKLYFAITGGGTGAIYEFLRHGGASSVFLGSITPYSEKALTEFIDSEPIKTCSEGVAINMAHAAREACIYLGATNTEAIGVGVTCSLAKSTPERAGREHKAYITVGSKDFNSTQHLILKATREEEEIQVTEAIIEGLYNHCLNFPERD